MGRITLVINILVIIFLGTVNARSFPNDFSFGVGSSAYQIEGVWNEDGKSENIWDRWIHNDPSHIANNATADVTCDSYTNYVLDSYFAAVVGYQHYRFSIPWTRILPSGFSDEINVKAIMHYQEIIQILLAHNVTPIATLYYHDLPQTLQDIGGWTNPDMAKYFADYARVCFQYLPEVEYWITFNDPAAICRKGYGDGTFAPGITSDGIGEYLCAYTVVKAHAAAYHLYKEEFEELNGRVSIAIDMKWSEPASKNDADAVERRNAFEFGLYANPIYKGNWPTEVIDRINFRSINENFTRSRLPEFTEEEIGYINGTSDFMAVNLFYSNIVEDVEEDEFGDPSYIKDIKVKVSLNPNIKVAENGQPIDPLSARKTLVWLSSTYENPDIFITENGIPDTDSFIDSTRTSYFTEYLNAILDAILEDEIKVIGYSAKSLMDSFEWTDGYKYRFGFYSVNFESPEFKTPKQSLLFYRELAKTFTIPDSYTTTISPPTTPGIATKSASYPVVAMLIIFLYKLLL